MSRSTIFVLAIALVVGCETEMQELVPAPDPMVPEPPAPPQIADGAFAGPVVSDITGSTDGVSDTLVTPEYRIVEVQNGQVHYLRFAATMNGPFDCWLIAPGSQRTVGFPLGGVDANRTATVVSVSADGFEYVNSLTLGSTTLSGRSETSLTPEGPALRYHVSESMSGGGLSATITTDGLLSRIGEVGTIPSPSGMNGQWLMTYPNDATQLIDITNLRVTYFFDFAGLQQITSSDPVTPATSPGSQVYVSFEAQTMVEGDVVPQDYTITFRGTAQSHVQITGRIAFSAVGEPDQEFDMVLDRVPSEQCN